LLWLLQNKRGADAVFDAAPRLEGMYDVIATL
jgi:hypothetical protein